MNPYQPPAAIEEPQSATTADGQPFAVTAIQAVAACVFFLLVLPMAGALIVIHLRPDEEFFEVLRVSTSIAVLFYMTVIGAVGMLSGAVELIKSRQSEANE